MSNFCYYCFSSVAGCTGMHIRWSEFALILIAYPLLYIIFKLVSIKKKKNKYLLSESFCGSGIWVLFSLEPLAQALSRSCSQAVGRSCSPIWRFHWAGGISFQANSYGLRLALVPKDKDLTISCLGSSWHGSWQWDGERDRKTELEKWEKSPQMEVAIFL